MTDEGQSDTVVLLESAAAGDQRAWDSIVDRYSGLVWSVARGFRLNQADAADVHQATWLRLVEQLGSIRDPERLGAWLATTARREALGLLRRANRDVPTDDMFAFERQDVARPEPDHHVLVRERDHALWRAFSELPGSCQSLLRMLLVDPPPSYAEVSAALDIPIGSIGPTRARCLEHLRRKVSS
ncbi:RNA polymerase sigma factor [Allorhizocola rhizosphaerae]|uniref:RNA polymerase sigma factor n=1 Tax=Allorhizocola rhizosphaerae TaxID=1872709 RepID=UPI000E3B98CD|nr:sigma-70 family RNA polymerase sigma factor [Allorhizocola rhizosphaerae]